MVNKVFIFFVLTEMRKIIKEEGNERKIVGIECSFGFVNWK